jgi:alkaline phosphatase D
MTRRIIGPGTAVVALAVVGLAAALVGLLIASRGDADGAPAKPGVAPRPAPIATGNAVRARERWARGAVENLGIASGEVTPTTALVWARASGPARMFVDLSTNSAFRRARRHRGGTAKREDDYALTLRLRRLQPATRYHYRAWFAELGAQRARSRPLRGTFKTAPAPSQSRPLRFVFGGDVGSGGYCRHAQYGFPIFHYMNTVRPDVLVALGDFIYGDSDCPPEGPDGWKNLPGTFPEIDDPSVDWTDLRRLQEIYFEHWRYARADRQLAALLAKTPMYAIWDDHEVMNDFGARWSRPNSQYEARAGYRNLVTAGRRALFAYGVLRRRKNDPNRLYRSFRWGKDLHLVITDTRSYRSRNEMRDGAGKTMLGSAQLAWLKKTLSSSNATWKVIASSIPISVPTGSAEFGRDGWADGETGNGFERELLDLLRYLDGRNVRNVVVITADLHFAQATRNSQDYDGDGDAFVFHEFAAGPLNARVSVPSWLDPTTNPQSLYGEGAFFNFGSFRIVPQGKGKKAQFRAETYDSFGRPKPKSLVVLPPS